MQFISLSTQFAHLDHRETRLCSGFISKCPESTAIARCATYFRQGSSSFLSCSLTSNTNASCSFNADSNPVAFLIATPISSSFRPSSAFIASSSLLSFSPHMSRILAPPHSLVLSMLTVPLIVDWNLSTNSLIISSNFGP